MSNDSLKSYYTSIHDVNGHLAKWLKAIHKQGDIREVRYFGGDGIPTGIFCDNVGNMAKIIARESGKRQVYVTLNPVNPEKLKGRKLNTPYSSNLTGDNDIARIDYLLNDFDPERPKDTSANDAEKRAAKERLDAVIQWLELQGITKDNFLTDDSGNGYHLILYMGLANTPANRKLCDDINNTVGLKFSDDAISIDPTVTNQSRITKPAGSWAIKGRNTPERPHRQSKVVYIPDNFNPINPDILNQIAKLGIEDEVTPATTYRDNTGNGKIDEAWIEQFCQKHNIKILNRSSWKGTGTKWEIICPRESNHTHTNKDTFIYLTDGIPGFLCFHSHCYGIRWIKFREYLEPGYRDRWATYTYRQQGGNGGNGHKPVIDKTKELPQLVANNLQIRDKINDILNVVTAINDPPITFNYGGKLTRVINVDGEWTIDKYNSDSFTGFISNHADFIKVTTKEVKEGENKKTLTEITNVSPETKVLDAVLAKGEYKDIPILKGVKTIPILHDNGEIITNSGYDAKTGYLIKLPDEFKMPLIQLHPTQEDVMQAVGKLDDIFSEFPWTNLASRVNYLGLILTWAFRHLIPGFAPMFVISKNIQGIGGGKLIDCASFIVTGHGTIALGLKYDDDKLENNIDARIMGGNQDIIFDNVDQPINSEVIARMTTQAFITVRKMRQNENETVIENRTFWAANGVNVEVGKHCQRRVVLSTIETEKSVPWDNPKVYKYTLPEYVSINRGLCLSYLFTIGRYWIDQGRPLSKIKKGSFEQWSQIIGGMLECVGQTDFLANDKELYEAHDPDTSEWSAFIKATYEIFGNSAITINAITRKLIADADKEKGTGLYIETLPNSVKRQPDEIARSLASKIKPFINRRFTNGYMVMIPKDREGRPYKPNNATAYIFTPYEHGEVDEINKHYQGMV